MIREAGPQDAAAVAAIWNHHILNTAVTFNATPKPVDEVPAILATRQAAGRCFLVLEEASRIGGFATYGQFRGGVGYAHAMEHTIQLAPACAGRGGLAGR